MNISHPQAIARKPIFPFNNFGNRRTLNFTLLWLLTLNVSKPNIRKIISFVFSFLQAGLLILLFHSFCLYIIFALRCLSELFRTILNATDLSSVAVISISDAKCLMDSVKVDYMAHRGPIVLTYAPSKIIQWREQPKRCCIGDRIFGTLIKSLAFLAQRVAFPSTKRNRGPEF